MPGSPALGHDARTAPKDIPLALGEGVRLSYSGARSRASSSKGSQADLEVPTTVKLCLSHRTCATCTHYDDDWDPVELARGVKVYMWWGKPANSQGETTGQYCGYCVKVYTAKFRGVRNMSMNVYSGVLGSDDSKLKLHITMVGLTVQQMVAKGGRRVRVNWDGIDDLVFSN